MSKTAKKWVLAKEYEGVPKLEDFKLVEEPISFSLKPGEIVIEAIFLTVDPYMRLWSKVGETLIGEQVARVKVSNHPSYPEGSLVLAAVGWRSLTRVTNTEEPCTFGPMVRLLPDFGGLCPSLGLGCLGMTGITAYFGLLDRGQLKSGEVVLVSGAAGAVGSVAGQIAKIKGCTVIGSAGSEEKCKWLKELGFDHVFNYKVTSVDDALKQFAPGGIDLHFDNVGGDFAYTVMKNHMKALSRVVSCGAISQYNNTTDSERSIYMPVIYKQLDVRGMLVGFFKDRFPEAVKDLLPWVQQGKLKYRETVTEGFERMPEAFISLFHGANTGKAVVKA
ncbi:hypothetical protein ACOMHN_065963 [Nucella lapillus]